MSNIKETTRKINLELASNNIRTGVIVFITPQSNMSQQTLIANLALMFSQAGETTLILDTDFTQEVFPKAFNEKSTVGLAEYISDQHISSDKIITNVSQSNVSFISSGATMSNENQYFLGDPRFRKLLELVKDKYDHILVNTASYDKSLDNPQSIISEADGVMIVCDLNMVDKKIVFKMMSSLRQNLGSAKLLGYVNSERQR